MFLGLWHWSEWAYWSKPVAVVVLAPAAAALMVAARLAHAQRSPEQHRRGSIILPHKRHCRPPAHVRGHRGRGRERAVALAGVPIAPWEETKHFKLIGTTGTGKSTAIRKLLETALRRGDRAVISDPEGAYLKSLGKRYRGDAILNPFEADSFRWDLFAELQNDYDVEQLASAVVVNSADPSTQEWRGYARTFLTAVMRRCCQRGNRNLVELWRLLAAASPQELRPLVHGTPAQPFLDPDNARMFGSIRAVTTSALGALEYIVRQRATPLSVRAWVSEGRGALFIPYRTGQIAALRTMIAAWIRLAIFEAMSAPEGIDQRLWFVVDELDALGAIDGLKDALARLRKFGGRCVLGMQSIAQVSSTYGQGEAQTIVENCGNTLILRCAGSENGGTSLFSSRLIGEREVIRKQRTRARDGQGPMGMRATRRSLQISEQQVIEVAVLPSELEQLPDLAGYLKTASSRYWLAVDLARRADQGLER